MVINQKLLWFIAFKRIKMEIFHIKARKIICDIVINDFKPIKVKSGKCRYNYKCHKNAVHEAINNKEEFLAMCFYIDDGYPIIHFLNINKKGKYIDNTLGHWSKNIDFYLIKKINKKDFFMIDNIFSTYREEMKTKIPWYIRWFTNLDRNIL